MFTIEDGIEIPGGRTKADSFQGRIRATLAQMKPGQSFVVPFEGRKGAPQTIVHVAKSVGVKITTRTLPDGESIRVWLVGHKSDTDTCKSGA